MTTDKPITEADLKEMEERWYRRDSHDDDTPRLLAEIRRLREALEHYGSGALWWYPTCGGVGSKKTHFEPLRADLRGEPGYKLARLALEWKYPPPEPCPNPKCDGIAGEDGTQHRCFKDGRWLDDGSEL